ncbi:MAG: hypothetical protein ACKODX_16185, partial [Gemmata sp.]
AALALLATTAGARADRIGPIASPAERALRSQVVVVGKVTSVEKATIDAPLYPGAANKVAHTIAVVKVESGLAGADGLTHIKVGFVTPAAEKDGGIRPGRGPNNPELKVDQEWLFFLAKNADGGFHVMPYMTPPVGTGAAEYKASVESAKKVLAAVADPAKALKAESAQARFAAAVAIVYKLRVPAEGAGAEFDNVALTAAESRPVLKALAEGAWKSDRASDTLSGYSAFALLGLTAADGWKPTQPKPGEDFLEHTRAEFAKWLDGPGAGYRVNKRVPKAAKK